MSVNKYLPHVLIIPEDHADEQADEKGRARAAGVECSREVAPPFVRFGLLHDGSTVPVPGVAVKRLDLVEVAQSRR